MTELPWLLARRAPHRRGVASADRCHELLVSRPLPLSAMPAVVLIAPEEAHEIDATRAIFRDYAGSLGIDLGFQDFEGELAGLPGDYAEPRGTLLLALVDPVNVKEEAGRQAPTLKRARRHAGACGGLLRTAAAGCNADYPSTPRK
jgi:hypothetical protein